MKPFSGSERSETLEYYRADKLTTFLKLIIFTPKERAQWDLARRRVRTRRHPYKTTKMLSHSP